MDLFSHSDSLLNNDAEHGPGSPGRQITALGQDEESKSDGLRCLWLAR